MKKELAHLILMSDTLNTAVMISEFTSKVIGRRVKVYPGTNNRKQIRTELEVGNDTIERKLMSSEAR